MPRPIWIFVAVLLFHLVSESAFASLLIRAFGGINLVNLDAIVGNQNSMNKALGDQSIQQVYGDQIYGGDVILTLSPDPDGLGLGLRYDTQTIKTSTSDRSFEFSAARTSGLVRFLWGKGFRGGFVATLGMNHYPWERVTSKDVVTEYHHKTAFSKSVAVTMEWGTKPWLFFVEFGNVQYNATGFTSVDGSGSNIDLVASGFYSIGGLGWSI